MPFTDYCFTDYQFQNKEYLLAEILIPCTFDSNNFAFLSPEIIINLYKQLHARYYYKRKVFSFK